MIEAMLMGGGSQMGTLLAVMGGSAGFIILDAETGDQIFSDVSPVQTGAAFNNAGTLFAVAEGGPAIRVYRTSDWQQIENIALPSSSGSHAFTLEFSPSDDCLAVGLINSPSPSGAYVIDTSSWVIVPELGNIPGNVQDVAFSYDGELLALARRSSRCLVFNTSSWAQAYTFTNVLDVLSVAFSPDNQSLIVAGGGPSASAYINFANKVDGSYITQQNAGLGGAANQVFFGRDSNTYFAGASSSADSNMVFRTYSPLSTILNSPREKFSSSRVAAGIESGIFALIPPARTSVQLWGGVSESGLPVGKSIPVEFIVQSLAISR